VFTAVALVVAAVHGTPLTMTPSKLEALALLALSLPIILGLATLSYRWIEVPARRLLNRRLVRPLPAPEPAAAPAVIRAAAE
jgi:peptidoglycan/LPS O-acetylase OafA/YrhL